jgi:hypothetical protein
MRATAWRAQRWLRPRPRKRWVGQEVGSCCQGRAGRARHPQRCHVITTSPPYQQQEKKPAAFGWDAFNAAAHHNAYERRAAKVVPDLDAYG